MKKVNIFLCSGKLILIHFTNPQNNLYFLKGSDLLAGNRQSWDLNFCSINLNKKLEHFLFVIECLAGNNK